jgi:hypothetical protein
MALLTRDQILTAVDTATEDIDVPEWGGVVRVKALTGTERDAFEGSLIGARGQTKLDNVRAKLVAMSVVDEDGAKLFSVGDITILGGKSAAALDRVFTVAQRLSKLTEADIEDLQKN